MRNLGVKNLTELSRGVIAELTRYPFVLRAIAAMAAVAQLFVILAIFGGLRAWITVGLLGCWAVWLFGRGEAARANVARRYDSDTLARGLLSCYETLRG